MKKNIPDSVEPCEMPAVTGNVPSKLNEYIKESSYPNNEIWAEQKLGNFHEEPVMISSSERPGNVLDFEFGERVAPSNYTII